MAASLLAPSAADFLLRTDYTVDLMEYQAKELFAKHDVPVTLGIVANTPEE
ncbi:MAG: ADP-forming succinate--CoA ligase subunit beta, partial [Aeromicrobium sp.]|nr:ADP-forming succinate--CoA ligase subunit beta [Aeromicrobium sp.]